MKKSEIEWVGEIPENWSESKLKRVVYGIDSGGTPTSSNSSFYSDKGVPFVNISDMTKSEDIYETQKHLTQEGLLDKRLIVHPPGTILYSMYASLGKVAELKTDATISQAILAFRPNQDVIQKRYLKYILKIYETHISMYSNGTTQSNLNREIVEKFKVLLPELYEQKKICDFLDEKVSHIDSIINDTKESIENLKAYKQSLITETVTKGMDPNVEMKDSGIEYIGDIPSHWTCGKFKYLLKSPLKYGANESGLLYDSSKPRYIRITDILEGNKLTDNQRQSLDEDIAKEYILKIGDLLFARSGATAGKTYLVNKETPRSAFAGYLIKGEVEDLSMAKYVYYYSLSKAYEEWKNSVVIQATIQNIGADKYANIFLPIPNKDELVGIVGYLSKKIESIELILEDKNLLLIELESYKKSIIYEYVTGKKEVK